MAEDRCPDTNSGQHKWRIKRTVFKAGNKYTFRVCTACGADTMVIEQSVPRKGRHRKG